RGFHVTGVQTCALPISKAKQLRIHTRLELIDTELRQTHEYRQLLANSVYFPNEQIPHLAADIKLLGIPGAQLVGEHFIRIRKLAEDIRNLFRWFDPERRTANGALAKVIDETHYEKAVLEMINEVLDEQGQVMDNASEELRTVRMNLYRRRTELRRLFD